MLVIVLYWSGWCQARPLNGSRREARGCGAVVFSCGGPVGARRAGFFLFQGRVEERLAALGQPGCPVCRGTDRRRRLETGPERPLKSGAAEAGRTLKELTRDEQLQQALSCRSVVSAQGVCLPARHSPGEQRLLQRLGAVPKLCHDSQECLLLCVFLCVCRFAKTTTHRHRHTKHVSTTDSHRHTHLDPRSN